MRKRRKKNYTTEVIETHLIERENLLIRLSQVKVQERKISETLPHF
jgi:hypothetical protein